MLDMKYVSPEYQKRLEGLATMLVSPRALGRLALVPDLVDTVPGFDVGLQLCDPPENGWERIPVDRGVITPMVRHINRARHGEAWHDSPNTIA